MKVSEAISALQGIQATHGDIDVAVQCSEWGAWLAPSVSVGLPPEMGGSLVQNEVPPGVPVAVWALVP